VHDLAAPGDHRQPAGQPTVLDEAFEMSVDAGQPFGVHPDLGGVDLHGHLGHALDPTGAGHRPRLR
jgi:hypothetical protein